MRQASFIALFSIAVMFGTFIQVVDVPVQNRKWHDETDRNSFQDFLREKQANSTHKRARDGLLTRIPEQRD